MKLLLIHTRSGYVQRFIDRTESGLAHVEDGDQLGDMKDVLETFRIWGQNTPPPLPINGGTAA